MEQMFIECLLHAKPSVSAPCTSTRLHLFTKKMKLREAGFHARSHTNHDRRRGDARVSRLQTPRSCPVAYLRVASKMGSLEENCSQLHVLLAELTK